MDERLATLSRILGENAVTEALCRLRINEIMIESVDREQARAWSKIGDEAPVKLNVENHLQLDIYFRGEKRRLNGWSDYNVWYSDQTMSTNLVILEAKKRYSHLEGLPQCLTYMGKLFFSMILSSSSS